MKKEGWLNTWLKSMSRSKNGEMTKRVPTKQSLSTPYEKRLMCWEEGEGERGHLKLTLQNFGSFWSSLSCSSHLEVSERSTLVPNLIALRDLLGGRGPRFAAPR